MDLLQITAIIAFSNKTETKTFEDIFALIEYAKTNHGIIMCTDKYVDWDTVNLLYEFND